MVYKNSGTSVVNRMRATLELSEAMIWRGRSWFHTGECLSFRIRRTAPRHIVNRGLISRVSPRCSSYKSKWIQVPPSPVALRFPRRFRAILSWLSPTLPKLESREACFAFVNLASSVESLYRESFRSSWRLCSVYAKVEAEGDFSRVVPREIHASLRPIYTESFNAPFSESHLNFTRHLNDLTLSLSFSFSPLSRD